MEPQPPRAGQPDSDLSVEAQMKLPSQCKVAILMCTYNGQAYLKEQIDSLISQTHQNWTLYISDDGSTDGTLALLETYRELIDSQRIHLFSGPREGFAKNFMSLVRNENVEGDFFAFSDQDDIWHNDKLERGIRQLQSFPRNQPALYCSRTRLINENRKVIGFSPKFNRPPLFQNALIQSIAGANTMLLNGAARDLLNRTSPDIPVVAHDWLAYLLTTACGGKVIYDSEPTLDYRQHGGNVIGSNSSIKERILRLGKLIDGRFSRWSDVNLSILEPLEEDLTASNRQTVHDFKKARQSTLLQRFRLMRSSGIYRQTLMGNISLILAIYLNKI
ncbi:glycosyltransferase family 2 protein [Pseudomonas koreensis]|uniref:glycosyltransferase family 2 protein n=1 Tax=Pseudomonas koreensis TaxID=198620 RepID=UPI0020C9AC2D|nr:glycosyltransferase family 2 protein [Pseudomonas koreensis]